MSSIYNDFRIQFVLKTYGGLCNNTKPFQGLHDSIYMSFTWKQFRAYQALHTKLEFFTEEQFTAITRSKKALKQFRELQTEAKRYYLSHYDSAVELDSACKQGA